MKDAFLSRKIQLPAPGSNANSEAIDFRNDSDTSHGENTAWRRGYFLVQFPALPDHTNTSAAITLTIEDSEDGETFSDAVPAETVVVLGTASTGSPSQQFKAGVGPGIRRYVRFHVELDAGAGNGNGASVTVDCVG